MKITIQTTAAFFAVAMISGGIMAFGQDNGTQIQGQDWTGNNDSTNKIVIPTPEYYTNNQTANSTIQQYRVQQEGVSLDGLVGQAAATGLFPGEVLVKNGDLKTAAGQAFTAQRAGRSSPDNGDLFHGSVWPRGN